MKSEKNSEKIIEKKINEYQIQLIPQLDSIIMLIHHINSYNIFESNFKLQYFQSLFSCNFTIEKLVEYLSSIIENKNYKIQENESKLKLIINKTATQNIELILNEKEYFSREIVKKLIYEIKYVKESSINEINKLKNIKSLNEKEKKIEKEEIKKLKEEIKKYENKIKEMKKKIKKLEDFCLNKNIQPKQFLKYIKYIQIHDDLINCISVFPSGNIVSVSKDKSINIYDISFNILQQIKNAHDDSISYINVKNENNFVTCSGDKTIKTWIKKENQFMINLIIYNAHNDYINKALYYRNKNIISCSDDKSIKIWEENKNKYQNISIIMNSYKIWSILLLEDKNIFVSAGDEGTKLWNLNNSELIIHFKEICCNSLNGLCRFDNEKIIVCHHKNNSFKVISILKKKIIKIINHPFYSCWGINIIEDKGIFLIGNYNDIKVYNKDNYECIQTIKDAHSDYITGFIELKNKIVVSYGYENIIRLWSF